MTRDNLTSIAVKTFRDLFNCIFYLIYARPIQFFPHEFASNVKNVIMKEF